MAKFLFVIFVVVIVLLNNCAPVPTIQHTSFTYTSIHAPSALLLHGRRKDASNNTWGISVSEWSGFNEFWLTQQRSDSLWAPPIFTGVPAHFGTYSCTINFDTVTVKELVNNKNGDSFIYR